MGNQSVPGYTDVFGKHGAWIGDHTGPSSYAIGGESVAASVFGGLRSLDILLPESISNSGNYEVKSVAAGKAGAVKQTGTLKWFYASGIGVNSVAIATAGSGQTNGTYTITDTGTNFTGTAAQVSITIAGGLITKATVINPGSGYTGAPTFTVAEGGTPGTLTGTVGSASGVEVTAATNLSGETVRVLAIGG